MNRSFRGRKEKNMSTGFNWFKSYKITIHKGTGMFDYDDTKLEYIGGSDTSHSSGNISKVQDLIEKYSGKRIPTICADWIDSECFILCLL